MAEPRVERERREPGTTLRVRLLGGLALAVVLPFVLFWYLGDAELRRATEANLGRHLLNEMARGVAERIGAGLRAERDRAWTLCASQDLRDVFEGARGPFRGFHARVSDLHGDLVLVSREGKILFQKQNGSILPDRPGRELPRGRPEQWLEAVRDGTPRTFRPEPDPFAPSASVSATQDPEKYVLPLVVPIVDDVQVWRGAAFFLLQASRIQAEIDETRQSLVSEKAMRSGEVYLVDRASGRYVLHTDRARIATGAEAAALEGFTKEARGTVVAASPIRAGAGLEWSAGVRVEGAELFRYLDNITRFFLVLVVFVLAATLSIATVISVAATRSLGKLERVTEELGAGHLRARADVAGPREVRKLAGALNTMASQLEIERERLKAAERDRAWTAMARQVAHEIKNPLQPVRLHAELILRLFGQEALEPADRERARKSAGVILRQVETLRRIVQDFSEYAHAAMPIGELVRFPAKQVMNELVQLYAAGGGEGVSVTFRDDGGDVELLGSPLRLQQVLVNLVKNAIEASEGIEAAQVEVTSRGTDGRWVVEVCDRGPGLPEGGARRAFEPSYSTKAGGTGLGLAICQRNVDAMHGRLELLSRPGGGVCARVELPWRAEP